ncbi:hypothetical protein PS9374_05722 [Planomonospora sphaerica]|uniref:Uncharacterized protein n=1 Tax=Planomonospora sphaerica TaxID=161355 RepID=A0A171DM80_9ACTN|nr:hypothetical protein [Planomonospora sphaerica]GAT70042.1 hypothetical protein PS9374_05722 [Planomonospora sphaerica]
MSVLNRVGEAASTAPAGRRTVSAAVLAAALALGVAAAPAGAVARPRPAAAPAASATSAGTFGPFGFGGVRLGMNAKKAKATKKIVFASGSGPCAAWDLKAYPSGALYISKKYGVAVIAAPKGVKTPRGIKIGSTGGQLKRAYPGVRRAVNGYAVITVPGNAKADYLFQLSRGRVSEMVLALKSQDCAN